MIQNGDLFKEMQRCDDEGYLISGSTPGEDIYTEKGGRPSSIGLVPGHAYSII